jgi:hypothetical protein
MSRCPVCEKQARQERAEARARGEVEGKPDRNGRVVAFSEEERKRRSELAKRLHAEGRFGGAVIGANGGRAVRRHRLTDTVLEHFRQDDQQGMVIKAIESALKGKNKPLRARTAFDILRLDEKVAERERADRGGAVDPAGMTAEELQAFVVQGIESMIASGEIELSDVIDLPDEDVREVS